MTGIEIAVADEILSVCPAFNAGIVRARVKNTECDPCLWKEIDRESIRIRTDFPLPEINKRSTIRSTRQVYKALGKDPNRYRPSAEALCRRIVKGMEVYRISTLVDLINLVSIRTGFSIGGFDASRIDGNLMLGVGKADEVFHGIGRGELNIGGLPVYRDYSGPIGTPTSDEERTRLTLATKDILIIINAYSDADRLDEAMQMTARFLIKYAEAENLTSYKIRK